MPDVPMANFLVNQNYNDDIFDKFYIPIFAYVNIYVR